MKTRLEVIEGNTPSEPGLYAARQWYGWRIVEWFEGDWWHPGKASKWPANAEFEAFLGPLPVISKDYTKPPLGKLRVEIPDEPEDWEKYSPAAAKLAEHIDTQLHEKVAQEFDL